ncbi:hypothetical protein H2200_003526 [Cladophialophora chaetospira]|uniref:Uncharacterized protein n=1 Tax=Cladophialophora chaetospira TaxID=386627 RepID=A0AA38XIE3_9EURO|nr:hypothetical protein H2200_003526 [Cladophialophora chaetospira]
MASPRTAPDGTPLTLLGMPWDVRRHILSELLSTDANTTLRIVVPNLREDGEEGRQAIGDSIGERDRAARREETHCNLDSAILETCSQLYHDGMRILLEENHWIAVIGRQDEVEESLRDLGMYAFWSMDKWNNAWDHRQKHFDLGNRVFRPEIAIRFPHFDGGVTLVPARHLKTLGWGKKSTERLPTRRDFQDSAWKTLDRTAARTHLDRFERQPVLWIGSRLANVTTIFEDVSTAEERECASRLDKSLGRETFLAKERTENSTIGVSAYHRHMRRLCQQVENYVLAGEQLKAMRTYQHMADRWAAYFDDSIRRQVEHHPDQSKTSFCFYVATYHASTLTDFSTIGWDEVFLCQWALMRADINYFCFINVNDAALEWKYRALLQLLKLVIFQRAWCAEWYLQYLGWMAVVSAPEHLMDAEKTEWARQFVNETMKGTFLPRITAGQRTELLIGGYPRMKNMLERFETDLLRLYGPVKKLETTPWGPGE